MTGDTDFTKDSEYIRLFDDDESEEFMEQVYKRELGSSFEKVEGGVSVGHYEEEGRLPPKPPMSPFSTKV